MRNSVRELFDSSSDSDVPAANVGIALHHSLYLLRRPRLAL